MSAAVAIPAAPSDHAAARSARGSTLTGTGRLLGFALRRDRLRILWWVLGIAALYGGALSEYLLLDDDAEARGARALLMESPAMISMSGPGYGLDDYRAGPAIANELILWVVLALSVMSILQIVRHTRAEEESSRSELVRAGVVGRHAPSAAALLLVVVMNVVVAVVSAVVVMAQGLDSAQTFAMTFAIGAAALVLGAVALVAVQVNEHARGATGTSLAVLGGAFAARAIGDIQEPQGSWVSWLSPIAWAQQTRVFVDLRWWPVALCLGVAALLVALAAALASRRDFGAGLVAPRRGPSDASASLRGPLSLAWLQQRGALLWTGLGLGVMWAATGTIIEEVPAMLEAAGDNPLYAAILGDAEDMVRAFLGIFGLYIATGAGAYGIAAAARAKGEEEAGRTELALASPVSRGRHLTGGVAVALGGALLVQVTGVLALWIGATAAGYDDLPARAYVELGAAYLPAVAVLVAFTAFLYAWLPRLTGVAWALVGYGFVVGMFAALFDLPEWAQRVSPFWWVGNPLVDGVDVAHLVLLSVVAVALLALAFAGFRRRDVPRV